MIKYRELAYSLLDHIVECWGVDEAVEYLYSEGYTKEQLEELGFEESDLFIKDFEKEEK